MAVNVKPIDPPEPTALARQQTAAIVQAVEPAMMAEAIASYVALQRTLDDCLPDCIMRIQGRPFRKKNYWRAVTTAFNLTVEAVSERWEQFDGDWCCDVTYRATAPNGRAAFGDGSCSFREKRGPQATRHNVRSHAHTRAYNRAVSNLVGFGEVSAEEVERDHEPERDERRHEPQPRHDAEFDERDRRAFMAALGERGRDYDTVRDFCVSLGMRKPSQLGHAGRVKLLERLDSPEGKARLDAFIHAGTATPDAPTADELRGQS